MDGGCGQAAEEAGLSSILGDAVNETDALDQQVDLFMAVEAAPQPFSHSTPSLYIIARAAVRLPDPTARPAPARPDLARSDTSCLSSENRADFPGHPTQRQVVFPDESARARN